MKKTKKPATCRERVSRQSADVLAEHLHALRDLFPGVVTEGKVDFAKLRALLDDAVDERPERYSFSWAGKRQAIQLLQTPSRATLVPALKESVNFDATQHLFIEGDNLEVLKLLYKAYFGQVKMIFVDPPYNTGNDFIYPDNFADPLDTYLRLTGQKTAEGNLLTSNPETSGRYHSAWLSMMYPRLFLARQLLRDDGVIVVSIDDHEIHNLRLMMNEIFGEENYLTSIAWQRRDTPANDVQGFSTYHEYLVSYAKQIDATAAIGLVPRTQEQIDIYKNPDNDSRGVWTRNALTRPGSSEKDSYPIKNPKGRLIYPPKGTSWRVSKATLQRLIDDNRLWWGADADGDMPFQKRFLTEVKQGVVPTTWWDYKFAGSMRNAKNEARALFDNDPPFDYPKPSLLIRRLLQIATAVKEEDVVLDFFAGSATTAHAILDQNREDGGNRRFIMVQLPEPTGRKDYPTIADIGKERIRRVIKKLAKEKSGELDLKSRETTEDLGFKVFKLAESNFKPWQETDEVDAKHYAKTMELHADPLVTGWKPDNVIYEVAVKEGYGLTCRIEKVKEAKEVTLHRVTDPDKEQSFLICLDDKITLKSLKPVTLKRDDLFICRDTALDDEAAANLALQCRLKTI